MDKLLQEIGQVSDLEMETSIEKVLQMSNEIYKEKILRMLVRTWKCGSVNYDSYKMILSKQSSFLNIFIMIKENNKIKFEENFPLYLNEMISNNGISYQNIIQQDCNYLLAFMLRNNQNEFMDIVINCPQFNVNKLIIESDGSSFDSECMTNLMTKLLENGYYVGNDGKLQISLDWISRQVFEKFLDSKIKEDPSRHKIKIDYNFLVDPSIRKINLNGLNDINEKLLFSSGMKALENILNNDRLRSLITHPVLSTFTNLKTKKYQLIVNTNFYMFLFGYLIPFFNLTTETTLQQYYETVIKIISQMSTIPETIINYIYIEMISWSSHISITLLTFRETVQCFFVCGSKRIYFKDRNNQFQILLISLSWISKLGLSHSYSAIPSLTITFGIFKLLLILPYSSMSIYMTMLQQVAKTFLKFFTIFFLIIFGFTVSFCVCFNTLKYDKYEEQLDKETIYDLINSSKSNISVIQIQKAVLYFKNSFKRNDCEIKSFNSPLTSFVKTLQMLSGDHLDPTKLKDASGIVLYLVFILTSFVLFNLINGLAISDIQILKEQAEFLNLKKQIRNGAEIEDVICKIHNSIRFVDYQYD